MSLTRFACFCVKEVEELYSVVLFKVFMSLVECFSDLKEQVSDFTCLQNYFFPIKPLCVMGHYNWKLSGHFVHKRPGNKYLYDLNPVECLLIWIAKEVLKHTWTTRRLTQAIECLTWLNSTIWRHIVRDFPFSQELNDRFSEFGWLLQK